MSTPDKYDEMTEALLPCVMAQLCIDYSAWGSHHQCCPAAYRPAVAAALREQAIEIERLTVLDRVSAKVHNANLLEMADMRERIERLEGTLAENLNSMSSFVELIESVMGREGKELWSRPDPIGLIAEIYAGLATPMQITRAVLEAK